MMVIWTWRWWLDVLLWWNHAFCILFYSSHFIFVITSYSPKQGNSLNFPSMEYTINNLSAREWTLWCPSLTDWDRPFSVERWKRRVLWWKRWMEELFIYRQSQNFWLWCDNVCSTFPYLYLDLECKKLCFPPRNGINRRNESTRDTICCYFLMYWR